MASAIRPDPARDLYLNLVRVHERLSGEFAALFREHGITQPWFNVLRILVTGPQEGTSCQAIGEQLLNRVPDVTRLIDRMVAAGLVERVRCTEDRRVVRIRITRKGERLCEELSGPVMALHRLQAAQLSERRLASLNRGLGELLGRS